MKIGFDIGGVISKYPKQFNELMDALLRDYENEVFIITDMHPKEEVLEVLNKNGIKFTNTNYGSKWYDTNVHSCDYEKHGCMAKAVLIKELGIDMFFDDHDGYLQWDSSLGPQPILLKVMPDAYKPYWADDWKCDGGEFGRRKYVKT